MKEIIQIIYSAIYQQPGVAKTGEDKLLTNAKAYRKIFKDSNYNIDLVKDLLIVNSAFSKWAKSKKEESEANYDLNAFTNSGKYYFIAAFGLMCKLFNSNELIKAFVNFGYHSSRSQNLICKLTYNHALFKEDVKNIDDKLGFIFNFMYEEIILKCYLQAKSRKEDLVYSEFLNSDNYYIKTVAFRVFNLLNHESEIYSKYLSKMLSEIIYDETELEKRISRRLVKRLVKDVLDIPASKYTENDEIALETANNIKNELYDSLIEFRTAKYKETGIKAFKILTNNEIKQIADIRPKSLDELKGILRVLGKDRISKYGEDIINIVSSFKEPQKEVKKVVEIVETNKLSSTDTEHVCPICGKPTNRYMGRYRKDGLCASHGRLFNNGKIILKDGAYVEAETGIVLAYIDKN